MMSRAATLSMLGGLVLAAISVQLHTPRSARGTPVRTDRYIEVPLRVGAMAPSATQDLTPYRDGRTDLLIPTASPRQAFGYEVGRGPIRTLLVTRAGRVLALGRETLAALDTRGVGAQDPLTFRGAIAMTSDGAGALVVDQDGLHRVSSALIRSPAVAVAGSASGAPLLRTDRSVVVALPQTISRLSRDGTVVSELVIPTRVGRPIAADYQGGYRVAAADALLAVDGDLEIQWRAELPSRPIAGPAVASDGITWLATRSALVRVARDGSLREIQYPAGANVRAATIAIDVGRSVRVAARGVGLWSLSGAGRTLWVASDSVDVSVVTVDARGGALVGSSGGDLQFIDRTGRQRWSVELGGAPSTRPVVARDGTILVGLADGRVVGFR